MTSRGPSFSKRHLLIAGVYIWRMTLSHLHQATTVGVRIESGDTHAASVYEPEVGERTHVVDKPKAYELRWMQESGEFAGPYETLRDAEKAIGRLCPVLRRR